MSKIFYISTQVIENYNMDSAEFEDAYHKFKFGEDYIITGTDCEASAIAFVHKRFCDGEIQYVCHHEECDEYKMGHLENSYLEFNDTPHSTHRINIEEYENAPDEKAKHELWKWKSKEEFFGLSTEPENDYEDNLSDIDADAMTLASAGMGTDEDYE
mgnify:CR=1 FL=1